MEERRLEGRRLLKAGKMSKAEISRHLGVSRVTVGQWARIIETKGMRGLQKRKAAGRELTLSNPQKQSLKRKLERGALANGYPTDRWTLDRVQKLIKREFDVTYHPNYLNRLLRKLGFSPQKPMPQAIEQEKELVEAWLLGDWPRIKKSHRLEAKIVFWDEFGFSFQEILATTWAQTGKRPIFRLVTKDRRALSTAVALTLTGKIYKKCFEGSIKSNNLIEALEHLRRQVPGKIILIWDRARIHLSKLTKAYLCQHPEIMIEELPAYAPQLNPEEYCHGNVKQHLRNARPTSKEEIRSMLDRGFARLRRRPDLLLGFFHAAGLSVRQLQLT